MTVFTKFVFNPYQECCYVASDGRLCVIIDPGCLGLEEEHLLLSAISEKGLEPQAILLTHAHFDHIYGVQTLCERYGIPVYMGSGEQEILGSIGLFCERSGMPVPSTSWQAQQVHDGDLLNFGSMAFEVISTPGHTPGSVCYLERQAGVLLSGDTLFAGSIGRTDLPGGDYDSEIVSIMEKLIWLDGGTEVLPGHGPATNIARERQHNPFLEPFNEPEEMSD